MKKIFFIVLLLVSLSCSRYQPYVNPEMTGWGAENLPPENELVKTLLFTGEFKSPDPESSNLKLLNTLLEKYGKQSATVLLGNLVYPSGLPDIEDKKFSTKAGELEKTLDIFKDYKGRLVFLPGNRDWKNGERGGPERVRHLEEFVEAYLDQGNVFLPNESCSGIVEIDLTKNVVMIIFDSQWWLQNESKYAGSVDCDYDDLETEEDYRRQILMSIKDVIERNKNKQIIFAAHHPLYSSGRHGGHFPVEENLFPLLAVNPYLWVPLPGFLYTGYRKFLGEIQDLAHPEYKYLRESLADIFKNYPDLIYISA
nr:metallophosphoesterase [Bacteroidota bacterium]